MKTMSIVFSISGFEKSDFFPTYFIVGYYVMKPELTNG